MVRLLSMIWSDRAGTPAACAAVRGLMARQLTQHRIASGFGSDFTLAAKSGGLIGVVRNEVGVVTDLHGRSFAVAIFTRRRSGSSSQARDIDIDIDIANAIGTLARRLVDQL